MRFALALLCSIGAAACSGGEDDSFEPPDSGVFEDAETPDAGACITNADPACDGEFCVVPGGCFVMGSGTFDVCRGDDEEAPHQVTIAHDVLLGRGEITRAEFGRVLGYDPYGTLYDRPVVYVSAHEAAAYANVRSEELGLPHCYDCVGTSTSVVCNIAPSWPTLPECPGIRLPTEEEWEHAYRAGTTTAFYSGAVTSTCTSDQNADQIGWYKANSRNAIHLPGEKPPNPWGLYDMAGNAAEWVASGTTAVVRSGSWDDPAGSIRAAHRMRLDPATHLYSVGFRIARTIQPDTPRPPPGVNAWPSPPEPVCDRDSLSMPVQDPAIGGPRIHLLIPWMDDLNGLLLIDSGAPVSFAYLRDETPEYQRGVGLVHFACEEYPFRGRNVRYGGMLYGRPVVGTLGTDWMLAKPTIMDLSLERLTRYESVSEIPDLGTYLRLPIDVLQLPMQAGPRLLAQVVIDGTTLTLFVDTGTPLTIWLGQNGRPGDTQIGLLDELGGITYAYQGDATLEIAGEEPFVQEIWRMPVSPFLRSIFDSFGGVHVDGILGLASFRDKKIGFGTGEDAILLSPEGM